MANRNVESTGKSYLRVVPTDYVVDRYQAETVKSWLFALGRLSRGRRAFLLHGPAANGPEMVA